MADFGDLIVVIPGILGSRLEREDGTLLYDLTLAGLPRTLRTLSGGGLSHLNQDTPPDDGVRATDLFNWQLLPGFFGNDDYDPLIAMLRGCVTKPSQQVIKFPYDWRASNRWAAKQLDTDVRSRLKTWQDSSGNKDAKLWLVCHSMGGLVARYFCEHLGGAEITRELITIGTPHRGAAKALDVLVNGMRLALLINVSGFIQSLPSVYELLPQYPTLYEWSANDRVAFRLADVYGIGDQLPIPKRAKAKAELAGRPKHFESLPNLNQTMLKRAIDFHAAIREPVINRMDNSLSSPYTIRCILNRRQPTVLSTLWQSGTLTASTDDPLASPNALADPSNRGDGTVPAYSAIPIEWDNTSNAVAVSAKHVGLPAEQAVLDVLQNWICPQDARAYMGSNGTTPDQDILGLEVPSTIQNGERLTIKVDALTAANINVTVEPANKNASPISRRYKIPGSGDPEVIELGTPGEGTWRITVTPEDRRRPTVSDYTIVLASE